MSHGTPMILISPDELYQLIADAIDKRLATTEKPVSDEYISRKEASEILGISYPTLREITYKGRILKAYRIGRLLKYKRNEVMTAIPAIKIRNRA
jgi:excisionase family DNA binding protein